MRIPLLAVALLLTGCMVNTAAPLTPTLTDVIVAASVNCALIDDKTYEATRTVGQIEAADRCARSAMAPAAAEPGFQWVAERMTGWRRRWEQVIAGTLAPAQARADDATEYWSMNKQVWLAQEARRTSPRQDDERRVAPVVKPPEQRRAGDAGRAEKPDPAVQMTIGHAQATCILYGFPEGSAEFRECFTLTFFEFARRNLPAMR
jgi:hypothetical protein